MAVRPLLKPERLPRRLPRRRPARPRAARGETVPGEVVSRRVAFIHNLPRLPHPTGRGRARYGATTVRRTPLDTERATCQPQPGMRDCPGLALASPIDEADPSPADVAPATASGRGGQLGPYGLPAHLFTRLWDID